MILSLQKQGSTLGQRAQMADRSESSLHEQALRIHKNLWLEHKEWKDSAPIDTQPTGTRHQRNQKLI